MSAVQWKHSTTASQARPAPPQPWATLGLPQSFHWLQKHLLWRLKIPASQTLDGEASLVPKVRRNQAPFPFWPVGFGPGDWWGSFLDHTQVQPKKRISERFQNLDCETYETREKDRVSRAFPAHQNWLVGKLESLERPATEICKMDPTSRLPWDWGSEIVEKREIAYTLKLGDPSEWGRVAPKQQKQRRTGKTWAVSRHLQHITLKRLVQAPKHTVRNS